jgi:hypothetical protein
MTTGQTNPRIENMMHFSRSKMKRHRPARGQIGALGLEVLCMIMSLHQCHKTMLTGRIVSGWPAILVQAIQFLGSSRARAKFM